MKKLHRTVQSRAPARELREMTWVGIAQLLDLVDRIGSRLATERCADGTPSRGGKRDPS
jgi:hypothetical protein